MRVSYHKVRTREGGSIPLASRLGCSRSRRELSGYSVSSYVVTHKNYGKHLGVITIPEFSYFWTSERA